MLDEYVLLPGGVRSGLGDISVISAALSQRLLVDTPLNGCSRDVGMSALAEGISGDPPLRGMHHATAKEEAFLLQSL